MSRHYLSERNKNGERTSGMRERKMEETRKKQSRLEGPGGTLLSEVIWAVLTVGVLGFWFGFGAALGTKMAPVGGSGSCRDPMVSNLEELISR